MTGFGFAIVAMVILAALWLGVRQRRVSPWVRAAERLGLRCAHRGASMEGLLSGLPVRVHASKLVRQRTHQAIAHVHCGLPLPLDLGLSIRVRGEPSAHAHGDEPLPGGPAAFRSDFEAWVDDAERADLLLGRELYALVVTCSSHLDELVVCDDGVHGTLDWGVGAVDRLRQAVEAAASVAAQLDLARHEIPVAPALADHRSGWSAFAGAYELDYSTTPLAVSGLVDAVQIRAMAERTEPQTHRLVLIAHFAEPLGLGVSVSSRRRRHRRRRRRASRERTRFARAFDVIADDVWGADQLLDRPVREALLALRHEIGPLQLTDDELRVHGRDVPLRREVLDHSVRTVAAVAKLIESHRQGGADRRGPYR